MQINASVGGECATGLGIGTGIVECRIHARRSEEQRDGCRVYLVDSNQLSSAGAMESIYARLKSRNKSC